MYKEYRIPAFSKAGIQAIPLPATAATPLSPRRPPPPMRVGYADHAGVAGRRGYAPATQARCDGEGRDFTPNAVSKRVRAKLMPLPSYRKRIFRSAVKVKPFGRASATLTEIEGQQLSDLAHAATQGTPEFWVAGAAPRSIDIREGKKGYGMTRT